LEEDSITDDLEPAKTTETTFKRPPIDGPAYDDGGAEFMLEPASDRSPIILDDPAYAPTRELPRPGRSYAFSDAEGPTDVDVNAKTAVVEVVPPSDPPPDETDECFAIPLLRGNGAVGGGRMYVRWQVSFGSIGRLLGARPEGRFVVRAHIVTPAWDGPNTETRDRPVDPDAEEMTLEALPEPAVVRVAVGWLDGTTFVPLAHSPALETTRSRGLVIWTTRGTMPVIAGDPRAASIARALDAAGRAMQAHG
jgi:hypothetical protein